VIRIIALTEAGQRLGQVIQQKLPDSELWFKPQPFTERVQEAFSQGDQLILICATGIAVRTLAPVLKNKQKDPAVLVLDELGQYVIPLLSGHEGGANDWAADVSMLIDAQLVMTTAKPYLKPVYAVGMGCERDCPQEELQKLLETCLEQAGLSLDNIESINSIDIKDDEVGLIELARRINKPYLTWQKQQLVTVESLLSIKSQYVFETVGVYGVAESAALYSVQQYTGDVAELVLNKQKTKKATCAIARSYPKPHFES